MYLEAFLRAALIYRERFTFFLTACLSRCSFSSGSISTVKIVLFIYTNVIHPAILQKLLQNISVYVLQLSYKALPLIYQTQTKTRKVMKTKSKKPRHICNGRGFTTASEAMDYLQSNGWELQRIEKLMNGIVSIYHIKPSI